MWMQVSTYSQPRHKDEVGWLVLCSAAFTPEEIPRYSFYRRLSGPQGQSGHEGVKNNLHPSDTRDRTRAVQPVVKRLAAWATWPTEGQKSDKFSSETLISAWGSFTCRKSTIRDQEVYFPTEGSYIQDFYALKKSIDTNRVWTHEPRIQWRLWQALDHVGRRYFLDRVPLLLGFQNLIPKLMH